MKQLAVDHVPFMDMATMDMATSRHPGKVDSMPQHFCPWMWEWLCLPQPPTVSDHRTAPLTEREQARYNDTVLSELGEATLKKHIQNEWYWLNLVTRFSENTRA